MKKTPKRTPMNRPTTPARIRCSIRGTPHSPCVRHSRARRRGGRDARRPLLIWSEHKPCLRRQTITTQILGIANRSASRSLVVRGALVCRSQGRERGENGPPIFAQRVPQNGTGMRGRSFGCRVYGCHSQAVAAWSAVVIAAAPPTPAHAVSYSTPGSPRQPADSAIRLHGHRT